MPTPHKKHKKLYFSEGDAAALIQRYDATTVLTLLQEIAQYPGSKIDWNELVRNTTTGISNAREYQMLWRHLAYRDALPENPGDAEEPLDDNSDVEYELEALPPISADSASEATACVKVMIASCMPSIPSSSTIEAPLTVNIPVCHSSRTPNESSDPSNLLQGPSIIFPVTVQRTPLPTVSSTEGLETKGTVGGNMASKRKRWSEEEDNQLRAAVQRWGEGNWTTMAKGENFTVKRTGVQLSQRWKFLRTKQDSTILGTNSVPSRCTPAVQKATNDALQQATNNALSCALGGKFAAPGATNPAGISFNKSVNSSVQPCNIVEAPIVCKNLVPTQNLSQKAVIGSCDHHAKSKSILEKTVVKCNPTLDSIVKTNTIASGARNVSSSNTVSQFKVAQTSSSLVKPTIPVALCSNPKLPNVRTDSSVAPALVPSKSVAVVTSHASCVSTIKPVSSMLKSSHVALSKLSEPDKHVTYVVNKVVPVKQEVIATDEFKVPVPSPTSKDKVQAYETSTVTTNKNRMPVQSIFNKGREDLNQDKGINLPFNKGGETSTTKNTSVEISNDNAVSQNSGECQDQGTVKVTENRQVATDSKIDGSQSLDQEKNINLYEQ
ncbi:putative transcription factor MYB-HB-like family [Lupinus albus]|uniref:Putative transcription factor MYB-HB-like family n=1 Tax=Lupinus albus TaxID=3870 RepID=A0A6A4PQN3_LUPAL|nr:putative transcription factor MYB-HB-like family [Lupinus albus]